MLPLLAPILPLSLSLFLSIAHTLTASFIRGASSLHTHSTHSQIKTCTSHLLLHGSVSPFLRGFLSVSLSLSSLDSPFNPCFLTRTSSQGVPPHTHTQTQRHKQTTMQFQEIAREKMEARESWNEQRSNSCKLRKNDIPQCNDCSVFCFSSVARA